MIDKGVEEWATAYGDAGDVRRSRSAVMFALNWARGTPHLGAIDGEWASFAPVT